MSAKNYQNRLPFIVAIVSDVIVIFLGHHVV